MRSSLNVNYPNCILTQSNWSKELVSFTGKPFDLGINDAVHISLIDCLNVRRVGFL